MIRVYRLTKKVLSRISKLGKTTCRICGKELQIQDTVVSRGSQGARTSTKYYHEMCAKQVNII